MCYFSEKGVPSLLAISLFVIAISGCGGAKTTNTTETSSVITPSVEKFEDPGYPFTVSIPNLFQRLPPEQTGAKNIQQSMAQQRLYFEVAKLNGIGLYQIASREYPIKDIEEQLTNSFVAKGNKNFTIRHESYDGQEMLVLEADITFDSTPPTGGHTLSYFFSVGGATWQIEFYSTKDHWNEVQDAARIAMASIKLRRESNTKEGNPTPLNLAATPDTSKKGFFPVETGTRWVYNIEVLTEPIYSQDIQWLLATGPMHTMERGAFKLNRNISKGNYQLVMSIKGMFGGEEGRMCLDFIKDLGLPKLFELTVHKDDLGIFKDSNKIFWSVANVSKGTSLVFLITTYAPTSTNAPSAITIPDKDGCSIRPYFFSDISNPSATLSLSPTDVIALIGIDADLTQERKTEVVQFRRSVQASNFQLQSKAVEAFTEDMWFEAGVGLIRLVQKVNGEISMKWELQEFTPGTGS